MKNCGSSSVGRASASQAEGREFESRLPLDDRELNILIVRLSIIKSTVPLKD